VFSQQAIPINTFPTLFIHTTSIPQIGRYNIFFCLSESKSSPESSGDFRYALYYVGRFIEFRKGPGRYTETMVIVQAQSTS